MILPRLAYFVVFGINLVHDWFPIVKADAFVRRGTPRNFLAKILTLIFGLILASDLFGQGTLIPLPARLGMVFDHKGTFLYIATYDGFVRRVNLASQQVDKNYPIDGVPIAVDIAPDDSFLLITEDNHGPTQGIVHRLDLSTGEVQNITYPLEDLETGSFEVVVANNGLAFFTAQVLLGADTTLPLRQIDLVTNHVSPRLDVPRFGAIDDNSQIARSADGSRVYVLETDDSSGPVFTYDAGTNSFSALVQVGLPLYNGRCAVSRNGTLIATGSLQDLLSVDSAADFGYRHAYVGLDGGVAFDGARDVLYAVNRGAGQIVAHDMNTFAELFRLNIGETIPAKDAMFPLDNGTLTASPNGHYVAVSTSLGVRLFDLSLASHVPPVVPVPTLSTGVDMVFDRSGRYLYVTTVTGLIERYDLTTNGIDTIADCGGRLNGIDISPDDSFLLVAQAVYGAKQGAVQKVDLSTGSVIPFSYDRGVGESGTRAVAIAANGLAFFTTLSLPAYNSFPPLRQVDLSTGTVSARTDSPLQYHIVENTHIVRNADRTHVLILPGGPILDYNADTNTFSALQGARGVGNNDNVAVSPDGKLVATEDMLATSLDHLSDLTNLAVFKGYTGGVAFDAVADVLYAVNLSTQEIAGFDTTSFGQLGRIAIGEPLDHTFSPFGNGHLVASGDGRFLAVRTLNGIKVIPITNPLPSPSPTPLPGRPYVADRMVFDHSGNLYFLGSGLIYKRNAATNADVAIYDLGGIATNLDIAPDDSFLLVTEALVGLNQGIIHKLDLKTGLVADFRYDLLFLETGAKNVVIASNGHAFFDGLRQLDIESGQISVRLNYAGLLLHSADRSMLCVSPYGNDASANQTYSAATDTWSEVGGIINTRPKALSRNGTLVGSSVFQGLTTPVTLSTFPNFTPIHTFTTIDTGIGFDGGQDVIFGINHATGDLIGYDTHTFAQKYRISARDAVGAPSPGADSSTVVPSPDGNYIAVSSYGGLHFYSPTGAATPTPTPIPTPTPAPSPPPTVGLTVAPANVHKGATATFNVSLSASNSQDVIVNYSMSGNAAAGADYTLNGQPNHVTIIKGQTSATVLLTATSTKTNGKEKATMTVNFGSGYQLPTVGKKHRVKAPSATVTINNK